jgi:site-specific DNA recombinase
LRGRKSHREDARRETISYVRVSTVEQAESGHSLIAQMNQLQAFAVGTGRTIAGCFEDDGYSAGSLKRPALQRMIGAIEQGSVEAVLVTKLDRLSRNLADLLALVRLFEKQQVALVSATEAIDTGTLAGRMLLQLLGVFAEFERGRIGERTRDVLADRRRQAKVYSRNTPFGFRREETALLPDALQQRALQEGRQMLADGASMRMIAAHFTALGVQPNNGGSRWWAESVRQVLGSRMARDTSPTGLPQA